MSISFQKKFLNGLKNKYNLTMEDIVNQDYKYIGGTPDEHNPQHYNQWLNIIAQKPDLKMPILEQECICGHKIKNNCFIMNKYDNIIVLGNCCIKRFIPKSGRTCGWCGNPHKNRKFNLCNTCKENACKKCGKDKEEDYYKYCRNCNQELVIKGKKIYLYVPYNDKEDAKKYGCRWNPDKKKWYFYDKNDNKEYIINKWKLVE